MAAAAQNRPNTSLLGRLRAGTKSFWNTRKITRSQRIKRDSKLDVEQPSRESVQQHDEIQEHASHPIAKSEDLEQHERSRNATALAKSPDLSVREETLSADTKIDQLQNEGVPITTPAASSVKEDGSDDLPDFTTPMTVIVGEEEHVLLALLDTGMAINAIHYDKVLEYNIPLEDYTGLPIQSVRGAVFKPMGQVSLHVYFQGYMSAKTYDDVVHAVLKDPPFESALGRAFINRARLLQRCEPAAPLGYGRQTAEEVREQERRTKDADDRNEMIKAEEKKRVEERRRNASKHQDKQDGS